MKTGRMSFCRGKVAALEKGFGRQSRPVAAKFST